MSQFQSVFKDLRALQFKLKVTVNRLWSIRLALSSAYRRGQKESDFFPRRLNEIKKEEQMKYDQLLYQLSHLISTHLDSAFISFESPEDVQVVLGIRKTIRYIRNAFVSGQPIGSTLARLNMALPASSNN